MLGEYHPPNCEFNLVILNLTVTSRGRQFDRLGSVYLGDIEVFRTSTAEPTSNGIIWTYLKDVTPLLPLFSEPQKLIFDLGNLINDKYTGTFNATLTATYYLNSFESKPPPEGGQYSRPADLIVPISKQASSANAPSAFSLPSERAVVDVVVPGNADRAIVTVAACGQIGEEFWWGNVPSSLAHTFPDTELGGYSAFREVQVLIDGHLAGVAWPFPVIFTGGVVPGLWSPIVGIDAFDLREDEIDISPFLPLLRDGKPHSVEIRVAALKEMGDGSITTSYDIGSYWVVTGKIFIWLGDEANPIGDIPHISTSDVKVDSSYHLDTNRNGTNMTLHYEIIAQRRFETASSVTLPNGTEHVGWTQDLRFTNKGMIFDEGRTQAVQQSTGGTFRSSIAEYSRSFEYTLGCNSTFTTYPDSANFSIAANVLLGKWLEFGVYGDTTEPTMLTHSTLWTKQNGTAVYTAVPSETHSFSKGKTEQHLEQDVRSNIGGKRVMDKCERDTLAENRRLIYDNITLIRSGRGSEVRNDYGGADPEITKENVVEYTGWRKSVKAFLGRGPA